MGSISEDVMILVNRDELTLFGLCLQLFAKLFNELVNSTVVRAAIYAISSLD